MPNWKKLLVSGSNAELNRLNVSTSFTASGIHYPTSDGLSGQALQTDGSGNLLFGNVTVSQVNTVTDSFASTSSITVQHNFNSKNVIVSAYDSSDFYFVPNQVKLLDNNRVKLSFTSPSTGYVVVAKGGHIVSGSLYIPGPQGNQGPSIIGPQGFQGNQGPTGLQGFQGNQGPQGNQGLTGAQGDQGIQGPQANQGPTGLQGFQGNQGPTGIQGTAGTNGSNGAQGNQGPTGIQGTAGTNGSNGAQGFQGRQGPQGNQGPTGIQGTAGTNGSTGAQGATGTGTTGAQGAAGIVSGVTKILFGVVSVTSQTGTVTFSTSFSSTPVVVGQIITNFNGAVFFNIHTISTTGFSYISQFSGVSFTWIAIN